jgi:uncharacterized protein
LTVDWTVYWFMLPVCTVVATVAMFSGISGAALLTPTFLIGFPLFGIPRLSLVAAIGTSLFLESSGFGTGLFRYLRLRLVDEQTAKLLSVVTVPLGALGAILARYAPADALRLGYGVGMLALAWLLLQDGDKGRRTEEGPAPAVVSESEQSHPQCEHGEHRDVHAASGKAYHYCAHGLGLQRLISGAGALVAGMISTCVGEATLPGLVRRSRLPVPVAAATSTVVVAGTVVGAATTHLIQLVLEGGLGAIPWNLIVWAVPGAILGAYLGTRLQGRVSERLARYFFAALFAAIGVAFLLAFTVFVDRFG